MREVSCRVFNIFFRPFEARRIPLEALVEHTNVTVKQLRDKNERVDWSDLLVMMTNLRKYFDEEDLGEIGRQYFRAPALRFLFVVARLLFTPVEFYRWTNKPKDGAGNQIFTCIVPEQRDISKNEIEVDLNVAEGYEVCWDFFLITRGNFEEMPRLLGYPAATVTLTRIPRGGRFHIKIPERTPIMTRVRRVIMWPFAVRATARELKEAHETLVRRYEELEDARSKLDLQATRLRTAHAIGDLIHGDLDLQRTLEAISRALVDEAGFAWAHISVVSPATTAEHGTKCAGAMLSRPLTVGARELGALLLLPRPDADIAERADFLTFVEPTLAMAVQNAVAYRELAEYKAGLERIVDERTAQLRQARDQLEGTVEQLREAQDARERFFSNISHEIRTPLSLILLAAGDIDQRLGDAFDERGRNSLVAVTDSARKLLRLVDELLLLAAGQADKLRLSVETTNVRALFEQLVAAWQPAADNAGLTLHVRGPDTLLAEVDPVAIERVVSNLVSNSVKYTPRGGRVELEIVVDSEHVRLSVLDTGPGIDADLAKRLFGRFERAAGEDRRKAGTGIGLALVKQLVEAHQGTVEALPRDGGGTEMRVLLPASIVTNAQRALPPTFLRTTHAPLAVSNIKSGTVFTPAGLSMGMILIAEDEPRLAESIARLLSERYTVVVALDGTAALQLVRQHQPQLLVTDVDMPGMNGIELSRQFRALTGDQLAPIVILSAVVDVRTRVAGLEAGAVDYVPKPFDPTELRARVDAQFRMRDLALRLHRAEQLSALGILTAGLAHELRNPANGIVNAIPPLMELLPNDVVGPDTGPGQLLEVMKGCADQIGFLTRQLLGFRNNTELELRSTPLTELVQRAVKLAKGALTGIETRTCVTDVGNVMCAPPLLLQVLTNLIENAGHAAGKGGWIEIRAARTGGRVTVEVADSGPGVPVELRERVFEPFFTTKAPGVGTGLGLSLARNIVHRHGGVLEIRQRGSSSVFVIELNAETDLASHATAV